MSLKSEPSTGDRVIVTSWMIMGAGMIPLALASVAIQNGYSSLSVYTPVLMVEGVGLTLNGVGVQLQTAPTPSLQDKLNIAGRLMLGLGLFSLGTTLLLDNNYQFIGKAVSGTLMISGAVCLGVAEDKANLIKWAQA